MAVLPGGARAPRTTRARYACGEGRVNGLGGTSATFATDWAGIDRTAHERHVPFLAIHGISDVVGFDRDPDWIA